MNIIRSHRSSHELQASVPYVLSAPKQGGRVDLLVVWKDDATCETPAQVRLSPETGIEGDYWSLGGEGATAHSAPDPDRQVRVMPSRVMRAIAGDLRHWSRSDNHFYIDMDLTPVNVQLGTVFDIGTARLVATAAAHIRHASFVDRFGKEASDFVYGGFGHQYRFSGFCARVLREGQVSVGDTVQAI